MQVLEKILTLEAAYLAITSLWWLYVASMGPTIGSPATSLAVFLVIWGSLFLCWRSPRWLRPHTAKFVFLAAIIVAQHYASSAMSSQILGRMSSIVAQLQGTDGIIAQRPDDVAVTTPVAPAGGDSCVREAMSSLIASAKVIPQIESGAPTGFRLTEIASDSLWTKLGFESEDVIKEVNGIKLDSQQAVSDNGPALCHAGTRLKVIRKGQVLDLITRAECEQLMGCSHGPTAQASQPSSDGI